MRPLWEAFGTLQSSLVPQLSSGLPCSASPSLYSVPLTFTSWMVTTVTMSRYEGWGGVPGVLPCEFSAVVSPL